MKILATGLQRPSWRRASATAVPAVTHKIHLLARLAYPGGRKVRPNPSLNADVPRAGAAPAAAGRRLASVR